jgi:hypothetical protein
MGNSDYLFTKPSFLNGIVVAKNKIKTRIELSPEQLDQTVTKVIQALLFRDPMPSPIKMLPEFSL